MKKIILILILFASCSPAIVRSQNLVVVQKLMPIDCYANTAPQSSAFDSIISTFGESIIFTDFNYIFKRSDLSNWLYTVQSPYGMYRMSSIGARLNGEKIFLQEVCGQIPPAGTGATTQIIENEMIKPVEWKIQSVCQKVSGDSVVVKTKITYPYRNSVHDSLTYIAYLQDNGYFPNEYRQGLNGWKGQLIPVRGKGRSFIFKATYPIYKTYTDLSGTQKMWSNEFKIVVMIQSLKQGNSFYERPIKCATYSIQLPTK